MQGTIRGLAAAVLVGLMVTTATAAGSVFKAAAAGKRHAVDAYLAEDPGLANARDKKGNTALHYAARHDRGAVAKLLLEKGAKPSRRNKKTGDSPLHVAAAHGSQKVAAILVGAKAKLDAVNRKDSPPLHLALRNGHEGVAKLLLDAGADLSIEGEFGNSLHYAATGGSQTYVELCLTKGYEINGAARGDGDTPLHKAVWRTSGEFIAFLISKGADASAVNHQGWTPLHEAAKAGNAKACTALLDAGVELEAYSKNGVTPLHAAVIYCGNQKRKLAVLELLLARKASPNPVDSGSGDTPLHSAVLYGDKEGKVVRLLLEKGADREAWNAKKQTPLALARAKKKVAAAKALAGTE